MTWTDTNFKASPLQETAQAKGVKQTEKHVANKCVLLYSNDITMNTI